MHQLILEVQTWQELKVIADRLNRDGALYCYTGKIPLIKDIRNMVREALENRLEPSLSEIKNLVDSHLTSRV